MHLQASRMFSEQVPPPESFCDTAEPASMLPPKAVHLQSESGNTGGNQSASQRSAPTPGTARFFFQLPELLLIPDQSSPPSVM
jgi:hypothetical protein